jgi:hypothetical protein
MAWYVSLFSLSEQELLSMHLLAVLTVSALQ